MTRDQVAVLEFVLRHIEMMGSVEILRFHLTDGVDDLFHVAVLRVGADDDGHEISLLSTLPTHTQGVFMAVTVGHEAEVARMLAILEDFERQTWHALRPLESVITNGPDDIRALFLLHPSADAATSRIPDNAMIGTKQRSFLLMIPITADEYACKMQGGADALLARLQVSDP